MKVKTFKNFTSKLHFFGEVLKDRTQFAAVHSANNHRVEISKGLLTSLRTAGSKVAPTGQHFKLLRAPSSHTWRTTTRTTGRFGSSGSCVIKSEANELSLRTIIILRSIRSNKMWCFVVFQAFRPLQTICLRVSLAMRLLWILLLVGYVTCIGWGERAIQSQHRAWVRCDRERGA